jgi:tRNA dimethylallyltransferase
LEQTPLPELLGELERFDPVTFNRIDRSNPRRVVRAIEVIRLTGQPFHLQRAAWHGTTKGNDPGAAPACFGLLRESVDLRRRIDVRVDQMFEHGLVDETRRLLEHGLAGNRTAMQAIGYRQVVEHLRGDRSLDETIALVKIRTHQFARRQMTWFRRQLSVNWITIQADEPSESIAARLLQHFNRD